MYRVVVPSFTEFYRVVSSFKGLNDLGRAMGRPVKTGTSVRSFFTEFHHVAQREVGPAKRKGNTDAQMVAAAQTIFFINRTQFRFRSTLLPTFAEPCAAYFGWPTNSSTSHKQWHQQLQHGIMLAPPQIGRTVAGRVGSPGARARVQQWTSQRKGLAQFFFRLLFYFFVRPTSPRFWQRTNDVTDRFTTFRSSYPPLEIHRIDE